MEDSTIGFKRYPRFGIHLNIHTARVAAESSRASQTSAISQDVSARHNPEGEAAPAKDGIQAYRLQANPSTTAPTIRPENSHVVPTSGR